MSRSDLCFFFVLPISEIRGVGADLLLSGLGSIAGWAAPVAASLRHKAAAGVVARPKASVECSGHSRLLTTNCEIPTCVMVG